jgi:C1A family cysteine protease
MTSSFLDYFYGILNTSSNITASNITSSKIKREYGWKKGFEYSKHPKKNFFICNTHSNIKLVDLREKCPDIYDQGKLGSCTANSLAFCYHFDELKQNESNTFVPSRLFIYYNERAIEGHISSDTGAEIHDGIKAINTIGVCPENIWPYDISKFATKPDDECFDEAKNHKSIDQNALSQDLDQLKACLISGYPVAFGFVVYENFESEQVALTGKVPMPNTISEKILGGHAVAIVGFDDNKKVFIVRNSWGDTWGDKGYFYMPYDYVLNKDLANDFWTIKKTYDEID